MTVILKEFWEQGTFQLPMWPSAPGDTTGLTSAGAPMARGHFSAQVPPLLRAYHSFFLFPTSPHSQVKAVFGHPGVCLSAFLANTRQDQPAIR